MKKLFVMMLCMLLLSGCTAPAVEPPSEPAYLDNSPVPNIRTGIDRSGITCFGHSMEVTENGVYFMCHGDGGATYLLYCDHGSDTLIKLCGRPDCDHTGYHCNARFEGGINVCYDGTKLYVAEQAGTIVKVYRLDPDGGNREQIMDNGAVRAGFNKGSTGVRIVNGICFFSLGKMVSGEIQETCFYFKLDGSMEQPQQVPEGLSASYMDGHNFIMVGPAKYDDRAQGGRYLWDPDTNTAQWLMDQPEWFYGYVSVNGIYYVDEGIIYRKNAGDETTDMLFDTGMEGAYELKGFPDCFVLMQREIWWREGEETVDPEDKTLYFYNWDYESMGEVEITYPTNLDVDQLICGETADRFFLADYALGVPEYYIEKSDLGTGNIEIHSLELPEGIIRRDPDEDLDPWEE